MLGSKFECWKCWNLSKLLLRSLADILNNNLLASGGVRIEYFDQVLKILVKEQWHTLTVRFLKFC